MLKPIVEVALGIVCMLLCVIPAGSAFPMGDNVTAAEFQSAIAQTAKMKERTFYRSGTGEHLADLAQMINPNEVNSKILCELESLLDSDNDLIRYWGAVALGNLGPRAKSAVPKLLKTLRKVDCLNGPITSANGIRYALAHIGRKVPPPANCPQRLSG